jgi:DNA replication ATP-dependent helicase Dna2
MVKTAKLRQSWFDTPCSPKSYVHIIGQFDYTGQCIVDNAQNMIILHPDHLISATSVADSFGCLRRAVLQDRVKATGQASPPMFYGTLIHEIFQEALKLNAWDLETLEGILTSLLPRCYESMVELSLNTNQIREYLTPKLLEMGSWANLFVQKIPQVCSCALPHTAVLIRLGRCHIECSEWTEMPDEYQQAVRHRGAHLVSQLWTKREHRRDCPGSAKK